VIITLDNLIDADEIVPGLWQGAAPRNWGEVANQGFNTLVLCAVEHQPKLVPGVSILRTPLLDEVGLYNPDTLIYQVRGVAQRVAARVLNKQKCLVTCHMGLNRSGIITAAALHFITGLPGIVCARMVQSKRFGALCNRDFVTALSLLG
jgi:protein-tyrosine phosphatase